MADRRVLVELGLPLLLAIGLMACDDRRPAAPRQHAVELSFASAQAAKRIEVKELQLGP
jgi:hypothetical protein